MASKIEELWSKDPDAAREEALRRISEWPGPEAPLDLSGLHALERIPDEVTRLSGLATLWLPLTAVSDIEPLAAMEYLLYLNVSGTSVTDLSPLMKLRELRGLDISHSAVQDLWPLVDATSLSEAAAADPSLGLKFASTPVQDDYLAGIADYDNPARTVEAINYLRRREGLEEFIPEGYRRPAEFPVPPDEEAPAQEAEANPMPESEAAPAGGKAKPPGKRKAAGKTAGKTRSRKKAAPAYREAVRAHSDDPAVIDRLNRKPLAGVIAQRMDDVLTEEEGKPGTSFAVHLDGAWGTGKSSMLNFMKDWLTHDDRGKRRWIVVEFNAWENERINPPWWPLIKRIFDDTYTQLHKIDRHRAHKLWFRWHWWRAVMDWLPILVAFGLALIAWWLIMESGSPAIAEAQQNGQQGTDFGPAETILKIVGLLITTLVAVIGAGRTMVFGSSRAAKLYFDMSRDPMKPVTRLFNRLIKATGQPVAIFIDDLDRCNADYVVDLLEGIQTLFRGTSIAYVVAADRKWLRRSFEKRYGDFEGAIGEPGRPLGYLFLEKIFQVSATVPRMGDATRNAYWGALLKKTAADNPDDIDRQIAAARDTMEAEIGTDFSKENIDRLVAREGAGFAHRVAAAQIISTSKAAQEEAEHRLAKFSPLLPENPRFMKRLVNAYGLHQAMGYLEQRSISADNLARWTIIEQRWPVLADHLAVEPESIGKLAKKPTASALKTIPEEIREFSLSPAVHGVVSDGSKAALSASDVREVTGGSQF